MSDRVDLARPHRKSPEFVLAVVEAIGVLTGIALIVWAVVDAVAIHRLPADGPATVGGIGVLCVGIHAWWLRDLPSSAQHCLIADAMGVQLTRSGSATYPWSQIAEFVVDGPYDGGEISSVSAYMRLQSGTKIDLVRLHHWDATGCGSTRRAANDVTERVARLNGMLARARHELEP